MNTKPHSSRARLRISLGMIASTLKTQRSILGTVGKYRVKETRSPVLSCPCGRRYIVTRAAQVTCLYCIWGKVGGADFRPIKNDE